MLDNLISSVASLMDPSSPTIYLVAFLGGLLSSFLPCSLSSLPLVIAYVGAGRRDTATAFRHSLLFALGMAITFTLMAAIALALGNLISQSGRIWYLILAVLTLVMALQMLGVVNIIPASYLQTKNTKRGALGAVIAGVLSGLFSSPCSTPALVALLSIASMSGSLGFSIALLLCYALGFSLLSIAAGTFVGLVGKMSASSAYRRAARAAEIILGLAVLLLSFYLFWEAF